MKRSLRLDYAGAAGAKANRKGRYRLDVTVEAQLAIWTWEQAALFGSTVSAQVDQALLLLKTVREEAEKEREETEGKEFEA